MMCIAHRHIFIFISISITDVNVIIIVTADAATARTRLHTRRQRCRHKGRNRGRAKRSPLDHRWQRRGYRRRRCHLTRRSRHAVAIKAPSHNEVDNTQTIDKAAAAAPQQ